MSNEFRDSLSVREYFISGLCQKCQDKAFADPDDSTDEFVEEDETEIPLTENIERVEETLSKVVKDIELKLPHNVFDFSDFYIAGGCIYSIWNNKKPNDYDIFCKNKKALAKIQRYFKDNPCNFVSENAITYGKYQFITKWCGDAASEVGEFDFKHNMFYYDTEGLHNLVDWNFLNSKKLVFNNLRARDVAGVLTRIPKFVSRGMDIDISETAEILDVITKPQNYIREKISIKRLKSKGGSGY